MLAVDKIHRNFRYSRAREYGSMQQRNLECITLNVQASQVNVFKQGGSYRTKSSSAIPDSRDASNVTCSDTAAD